jgi:hypothetical protein
MNAVQIGTGQIAYVVQGHSALLAWGNTRYHPEEV